MALHEISMINNENDPFIGNSPEAKRIKRAINKFSRVKNNVFIFGETGTGKEFIARKIHNKSVKKNRPFVVLNCSAVGITIGKAEIYGKETEQNGTIQRTIGILEKAQKGTLYLDQIADLSLDFQFELLQIIREQKFRRIGGTENIPFQVRIISSTDRNIEHALETGKFRKDLYYLLNSLSINVPSLKETKQDIPELFIYFLKNYCHENDLEIPAVPAEIFESILEYNWKGNIRELKNCIENLVMMSPDGELSTEFLPFEIKRHPLDFIEVSNLKSVISDVETYLIRKALNKFAGNQVKAARLLGIPEATLRFKMKKYAIPKD